MWFVVDSSRDVWRDPRNAGSVYGQCSLIAPVVEERIDPRNADSVYGQCSQIAPVVEARIDPKNAGSVYGCARAR